MTTRGPAAETDPSAATSATDRDPFASFWMGGYEGADHVNSHGVALDMAAAHGHIDQLEDDHRRAAAFGIGTVRESIGWRLAEPTPGRFDLGRTLRIAASARRHGLQVIWTLMHYGTPPDLSLYDDAFCDRFERFATTLARAIAPFCVRPPVFNLINEIGFLAWAVAETALIRDAGAPPPPTEGSEGSTLASGYALKRRLVRATLQATAAIRRILPDARFIQIEPVVHVAPPRDRPECAPLAQQVADYQWQVWDLLAARVEPELGGGDHGLDLVGVNHYHSGQWEVPGEARLVWRQDPRRRRFGALLEDAWQRYRRPLVVAETSHVGEGRAAWLDEIASEVRATRRTGVPVLGLCLYPLVDRPDWDAPDHWHHSGLWDVATGPGAGPPLRRLLATDYAAALRRWQLDFESPPRQQGAPMSCLIVFSHLRWGFVYQRPQHLMSRLAKHYRVLFIEEPIHCDGEPFIESHAHGPNLEVLVPHTPVAAPGFHDDQLAVLEPLISRFLDEQGIADCLAWFYTPMALPLLAALRRPHAVVYDCMDELAAFRNAPRQLRQRESGLLKIASLVFTGGPALYDAKRELHPNVHCLPSSVDAPHYSPGRLDPASAEAVDVAALQGAVPGPRLGFFGVIDERFDIALLAQLAEARPDWQFVMVGPVVKIDPAHLPQGANIHWLGMQSYARLPYFLAGWDVALMPFALNESTRFISPTKTLEYMAGEKPIVSTPVPDVIGLYGDTVRIAATPAEFIAACEHALAEHGAARNRRIGEMLATVSCSSWDRSAESVHRLLEAELQKLAAQPLPLQTGAVAPPLERARAGGTPEGLRAQPRAS